jgi:hypothetical protein
MVLPLCVTYLLTDLALVVQPRINLHRCLDCCRLYCQSFGFEVRIGCRAFTSSDILELGLLVIVRLPEMNSCKTNALSAGCS